MRTSRLFRHKLLSLILAAFVSMNASATIADVASEAIERRTPDLKRETEKLGFPWGAPLLVRIFKEEKSLEIWMRAANGYKLFRSYEICTYSGDLGPKLKEGDKQSPEGFYSVTPAQMNPDSDYHLSFNLGFPNALDAANGRSGSFLMVHGDCVSVGCYAMATTWLFFGSDRNRPIEEIWTLMKVAFGNGQKAIQVQAYPFRMSEANLTKHAASQWISFWRDLKAGYDLFDQKGQPPKVSVVNKRYVFE